MKKLIALLIFLIAAMTTPAYADGKLGVLLMHGKGGTSKPKSPIGRLATFLDAEGILVIAPDMPWSRSRGFDKSYQEAMDEIDDLVAELKNDGATIIVVGGHSIGANAALGYGASRHVNGILAIAPGHIPDVDHFQAKLEHDWKRAIAMVNAGEADKQTSFNDFNQGSALYVATTPSIYLSWYSPTGPAVMPTNTAKLKPNTALLWIIGSYDRMYERGKAYAFNNAPAHPNNAYVVIDAGHRDTPKQGKTEILDWLNNLTSASK